MQPVPNPLSRAQQAADLARCEAAVTREAYLHGTLPDLLEKRAQDAKERLTEHLRELRDDTER